MTTYAVVKTDNNICDNIIVWDDTLGPWTPPSDHYIVNADGTEASIGWHYDANTQVWTAPPMIEAAFNPAPIFLGQTTTLLWSTTNAIDVTIGVQSYPANGTVDYTPSAVGKFSVAVTANGLAGKASTTANVSVYATQGERDAASVLV